MQRLAAASDTLLRRYYRSPVMIEWKSDQSPVTEADRATEDLLRGIIMKEFPEHGILGEEYGCHQESARFQWVLDPIDGTKSFISGTPLFGTLIALCEDGIPILGCINLPMLRQRYIGNGIETTLNGQPVRMRRPTKLRDATLLVTDHTDIWRYKDGVRFDRLATRVGLFRSWGDCYGYSLLASGYADVMIDPVLKPWDMYALIPVIHGAGGITTSYEGGDALSSDSLVAAHPSIHGEVIAILNAPEERDNDC
jgi:myo-inositol-1(or 4)-monophosphatase